MKTYENQEKTAKKPAPKKSADGSQGKETRRMILDAAARLRRYREYVYETGAVERAGSGKSIDVKILEKERRSDFELSRIRKSSIFCNQQGFGIKILSGTDYYLI